MLAHSSPVKCEKNSLQRRFSKTINVQVQDFLTTICLKTGAPIGTRCQVPFPSTPGVPHIESEKVRFKQETLKAIMMIKKGDRDLQNCFG